MEYNEIIGANRLEEVFNEIDKKLDLVLQKDYLLKTENIIEILQMYDTALWKCYPYEFVDRIEVFLLEN